MQSRADRSCLATHQACGEKIHMRIIDAHHHYWDPVANYHPWLRDEPMIPFRYGDYSAIRSEFLPPHYQTVSADWDVAATVTMEGEWNPEDPVGESRWMQSLHEQGGQPAAHVSQAWLDSDQVASVLEQLSALSIVKSVRHKPRANPSPGGAPGGMTDQAFISGFKQLRDYGLHFDLQTPWWHLDEAIEMSKRAEDTLVILNHTGLPSHRSPDALDAWYQAMQRLAALEQVRVKISGLGLADQSWSADGNRAIILKTIDLFGVDRCLFASNFPVDGLCGSYNEIYQSFMEATADFTPSEQASLFCNNAVHTYQLPEHFLA